MRSHLLDPCTFIRVQTWDSRATLNQEVEIALGTYFRLLQSYFRLVQPEVCNFDGEVIAGGTLYFDIESPQPAVDALAPLALGVTRRELLGAGKFSADGKLNEVTIPWLKSVGTKDSSPEKHEEI